MTKKVLLGVAAALIVLGGASFVLQPVLDPRPEAECAPEGATSSGYVEDGCQITIGSWEEISDWETKPKVYRIVGALLILTGVGAGIAAVVVGRRRSGQGKRRATDRGPNP